MNALLLALAILAIPAAPLLADTSGLKLSPEKREELRREYENSFNEMDLMIKNERTDKSDLARVERELGAADVKPLIPMDDDLQGLRKDLEALASAQQIQLESLKLAGRDKPSKPIPAQVFTDERFRLSEDQVLETVFIQALIKAPTENAVAQWIDSWARKSGRIVEADLATGFGARAIKALGGDRYLVNGRTYQFRKINYPKLKARDPMALLPTEARTHFSDFKKQEPQLAKLIEGIQKLKPKAERYYRDRERFMLATARLNTVIRKAKARESATSAADTHSH